MPLGLGAAAGANPYLAGASALGQGIGAAAAGPAYSSATGGRQSVGTGNKRITGPTFGGSNGGVAIGTPTVIAIGAVAVAFIYWRTR